MREVLHGNKLESIRGSNSPTDMIWVEILDPTGYLKVGGGCTVAHLIQPVSLLLRWRRKYGRWLKQMMGDFNHPHIDWLNACLSHAVGMRFPRHHE